MKSKTKAMAMIDTARYIMGISPPRSQQQWTGAAESSQMPVPMPAGSVSHEGTQEQHFRVLSGAPAESPGKRNRTRQKAGNYRRYANVGDHFRPPPPVYRSCVTKPLQIPSPLPWKGLFRSSRYLPVALTCSTPPVETGLAAGETALSEQGVATPLALTCQADNPPGFRRIIRLGQHIVCPKIQRFRPEIVVRMPAGHDH